MSASASLPAHCFHCSAPIPFESRDITVTVGGERHHVCCIGCRESAAWIDKIGMADYYSVRQQGGIVLGVDNTAAMARSTDFQVWERPELLRHVVRDADKGLSEVGLLIDRVRCNGCVLFIERMLMQLTGVELVQVNALTRRARIVFDQQHISLAQLLEQLSCFGYAPRPLDSKALDDARRDESRDLIKRLVVAGFGMMQAMMFALIIYLGSDEEVTGPTLELFRWLGFLVTTPVVLYSAQPFFQGAIRGLRGKELNMDVPIGIAIALIYCASLYQAQHSGAEVYFDSVSMLVFFLLTGRYLEMRVRHRAMDSTDALARLTPSWAERQMPDGTFEKIGVHELVINDVVRVQEGGHIPADGVLLSARAQVDESLLSGESTIQFKQHGDAVIAGSVVAAAALTFSVSRSGGDTFLATLAHLASRAQAMRPRLAQAGQKAAARFVVRVLALTVVTAVSWFVVQPERVVEASLAVLVVSCPCAFALAVPAAITRMISVLARRGILIVDPDVIENLAQFDHIIFDKTGTLTNPSVSVNDTAEGVSAERALRIGASLAQQSRHPLSKAMSKAMSEAVSKAMSNSIENAISNERSNTSSSDAENTELFALDEVVVEAGKGISATLHDGKRSSRYRLGRADFAMAEAQLSSSESVDIVLAELPEGASSARMVATFTVCETLRDDARETITTLQRLGIECEIASGDAEERVRDIAASLNITQWRARQLPADKLARITALQQSGHRVMAIGDGSNDAPVLAGANVSVALASGTDLAQAQADVVLCSDRLEGLPVARVVAQQALTILRYNQRWALCYNLVAMPLAALGFVPPWLAAIGMSTSSLLVVLNALRIGGGAAANNRSSNLEVQALAS